MLPSYREGLHPQIGSQNNPMASHSRQNLVRAAESNQDKEEGVVYLQREGP